MKGRFTSVVCADEARSLTGRELELLSDTLAGQLRQAIAQLGVQGVTVTEVYEAQFGPRAKIEIAVDDGIVEPVLEAIANIARTGRTGDGRIFVGELEQTIRIRTGETGSAAT